MSKFCPVAPLNVLEALFQNSMLGANHLLLAHDIAKPGNEMRYSKLFCRPAFEHVILDNSVVELGQSVDLDMIKIASQHCNPTCVVLPDTQFDTDKTIRDCYDACIHWPTKLESGTRFMYVPQGKTLHDFARGAEALAGEGGNITYWGIPRNLVANIGTRREAIAICHALNPDRYIHLLGFSDNMVDDLLCTKDPRVLTIDSAVPLRCPEEFTLTMKSSPRGDWWDKAELNNLMFNNLQKARQLFS